MLKNVIKPSIPMRSQPSNISELETECLFGETLEVLKEVQGWFFCKLLTDNYFGWIQKKNVGNVIPASHRIIAKRTFLFKDINIKLGYINYLPLGAQVCVKDIKNGWAKVYIFENGNNKFGYIPSNHIIRIEDKINDWVITAEKLIGTPYVWGGRDTMGIDCSALLQLSYQSYGQNIPRNSNDQLLLKKEIITNKNQLERGFVVFWQGHVGIMVDEINCVHANAFHMEVSKEPLLDITKRAKSNNILKIMNFN